MAVAGLSAVMEALETWAAERLPSNSMRRATANELLAIAQVEAMGTEVGDPATWGDTVRDWVPGWDLANDTAVWVPAAKVATDYTLTSPFRAEPFQRTTTGLGAGTSAQHAVQHGLAEIIERHATAAALGTHGFFDRHRLSVGSISQASLAALIAQVRAAGLLIGFWTCPAPSGWSVVWARVLEAQDSPDQLPFPADGFAAHGSMQVAAEKALLEAVQTRVSVIAGSREDITRRSYPRFPKRDFIDAERHRLSIDSGAPFAPDSVVPDVRSLPPLDDGSPRPVIAVPLYSQADPEIHVVRMIVPGMDVSTE